MALVNPQTGNNTGGAAITFATPTTSETFAPGPNIYYLVMTAGTGITATLVVPGTLYGQARPDVAYTITTNSNRLIGPLTSDLADPATGLVTITLSATTKPLPGRAFTLGELMPRFEGVWMYHPGFDAVHYVPGNPGVIKSFEARDWQQTDLPADLDDDDPEFLEALEALKTKKTKKTKKTEPVEAEPATEEEGSE